MRRFDFVCRACALLFEETVETQVRTTICRCGRVADRKFSPNVQLLVPGGFRKVTRSDVVPEKKPTVWPGVELKKLS